LNKPRFAEFPPLKQKMIYNEEYSRKMKLEHLESAKMQYLKDTLKKERRRVKAFYKEKKRHDARKAGKSKYILLIIRISKIQLIFPFFALNSYV